MSRTYIRYELPTAITNSFSSSLVRYVEKLEQQQTWLVHGLQELYHRTIIDDEGCWPDHQLKPEFNDQLPIHDLLTYLGIIDKAKGERFEESPEALQYSLWRHDGMHIQEPSDSSSTSTQSPVICQLLPSDFTSMCSQGTMSPILPSFNSATQLNSIKHDFELVTETVAIDADISYLRCQEAMCMQSVPNTSTADSVSLGGPIWNGIGLFNEINPFYIESYGDLCLNDSTSPSGFISPMSMEYVQMNDCNDSFDLLNKEDSTDIFLDQETFSWARG